MDINSVLGFASTARSRCSVRVSRPMDTDPGLVFASTGGRCSVRVSSHTDTDPESVFASTGPRCSACVSCHTSTDTGQFLLPQRVGVLFI
jgi:hypothetical protein